MKHKIEVLERQVAALLDERDKLKEGYWDEVGPLRAFAQAVMEYWPMGDLDGGTLQEIAEKHGMLKPETRHEPCAEGCNCSQYADAQEWVFGVVCYRKTPLLTGPNVEVSGLRGFSRRSARLPGWAPGSRRTAPNIECKGSALRLHRQMNEKLHEQRVDRQGRQASHKEPRKHSDREPAQLLLKEPQKQDFGGPA